MWRRAFPLAFPIGRIYEPTEIGCGALIGDAGKDAAARKTEEKRADLKVGHYKT